MLPPWGSLSRTAFCNENFVVYATAQDEEKPLSLLLRDNHELCLDPPPTSSSTNLLRTALPMKTASLVNEGEKPSAVSLQPGSASFIALCGLGGAIACGGTHYAILPLDVVKCRMQADRYFPGLVSTFKATVSQEGPQALLKGWAPTTIGYSLQGFGKFGYYEGFKGLFGAVVGEEAAYEWRTTLYLTAAAAAEACADVPLAPFEAIKVRMQTSTGAPCTMRECDSLMYREEGIRTFFKGLPPLWGRQLPYTMVKFACFERTVEAIYKHVVPKPKEKCNKVEQLLRCWIHCRNCVCCCFSPCRCHRLCSELEAVMSQVARELGPRRLWSGLLPRLIMIGSISALQWLIYDGFKVAMQLPRPPPPQMPESLRLKLVAKLEEESKMFTGQQGTSQH